MTVLRGNVRHFSSICSTLFPTYIFYACIWKFRYYLLQGTHWSQFFVSKRPLLDLLKKLSPFLGVTMKNQKIAQNNTFSQWNVLKLGQNEVCTCLVYWKVSKHEKVSGNTVFWFFPVFPSVANISGGNGWNSNFLPNSEYLAQFPNLETIKKQC